MKHQYGTQKPILPGVLLDRRKQRRISRNVNKSPRPPRLDVNKLLSGLLEIDSRFN
jgi:hypothetical protein